MNERDYQYKVCTRCLTFNHAHFIVDAMNGFSMQNTSFPVITVIVDDGSTDGEPDVIRQYLKSNFNKPFRSDETEDYYLICANHLTNPNCTFIVFLLKYNHYCLKKSKLLYLAEWWDHAKYHAICEGDDYWIDPFKLQKQVSFLEQNRDFTMCFHQADVINKEGHSRFICDIDLENREYLGEELYQKWIVPTASILYSSRVKVETDNRFMYGDIVIVLSCANSGRVFFFSQVMSVYRRHVGGISFCKPEYKKWLNHHLALREHFPKYHNAIDKYIARIFVDYFCTGGINRVSWEVLKDMCHNPQYIIPTLLSFPLEFKNYILSKSTWQHSCYGKHSI